LVLPYPIVENLDPTNIARFEEQSTSPMGVDLEVQSTRVYPYQTTAAHLLGSLRRDDSSAEGEEAFFSYRLPDYRGDLGIEYGFDKELRGTAGAKSVLVNNVGYRQTENIWSAAEPGHNVVLTIDLHIQQVAENALRNVQGPTTRGAVVVMDVHTGDILAMASSPTLDPNLFVHRKGIPREELQRINDLYAQKNRATQENYAPGSIFKTVVGLAALEAGLNPHEIYQVQPNPEIPGRGAIFVGRRKIKDLAPPGQYDFRRALMRSSNSYFITNGLRANYIVLVAKTDPDAGHDGITLFIVDIRTGVLMTAAPISTGVGTVATPNGLSGSCGGGTITAVSGSSTISSKASITTDTIATSQFASSGFKWYWSLSTGDTGAPKTGY
jgi:cell division protein FtsI/penicillin-binding protein 2